MKRILCFAGSNKSTSINQKFVKFAASQIKGFDVKVIKRSDYEFTMYGEDVEKELGYSSELRMLHQEIADADGIIISVNEHNSGVSAFFKNIT
ncbi:NAD(P)H-dependent oxidoreductase [candidate division KSB1 bacterium]|nr:NAD(P)H-dependent oxidoreductase [candidate division KSB1 bacterium]